MARIGIIHCRRIEDESCVACTRCYQGRHCDITGSEGPGQIDLAAITDCGDCPGMIVPRARLLMDAARDLGRELETLYLGTCIKAAMAMGKCPLEHEPVKAALEKEFGIEVVLGSVPLERCRTRHRPAASRKPPADPRGLTILLRGFH